MVKGPKSTCFAGPDRERFRRSFRTALLHATVGGSRYQRIPRSSVSSGPFSPAGYMEYAVRLFAQDGDTVVEET